MSSPLITSQRDQGRYELIYYRQDPCYTPGPESGAQQFGTAKLTADSTIQHAAVLRQPTQTHTARYSSYVVSCWTELYAARAAATAANNHEGVSAENYRAGEDQAGRGGEHIHQRETVL